MLSKRENEIMGLVGQGKQNDEIAGELFISEHTVRNHMNNVYRKLKGVGIERVNRVKAVNWYRREV